MRPTASKQLPKNETMPKEHFLSNTSTKLCTCTISHPGTKILQNQNNVSIKGTALLEIRDLRGRTEQPTTENISIDNFRINFWNICTQICMYAELQMDKHYSRHTPSYYAHHHFVHAPIVPRVAVAVLVEATSSWYTRDSISGTEINPCLSEYYMLQ